MKRPYARPFNNEFGYAIIDILLKHEPHASSYSKVRGEGDINHKTLSAWLKRLESLNIITRTKRSIRLTSEAKERREQKTLVLPTDERRKKKKKTIFQKDRDRYSILFILFNSAHLVFEDKTEELDKIEDVLWTSITWRKGIVVDDLAFKLKRLYHPYMPNPPRFENRLHGCNIEIFRHLELSPEEAEKYLILLKHYKPYPILVDTQYENQIRYEIEDKSLEDFLQRCLYAFADVYFILEFYYKNKRLETGYIKKYEKEYKESMNGWFGDKQNYYSLNVFPPPLSRLANVNKKDLERDLRDYYGMPISLLSSSATKEDYADEQLERAIKNIYNYEIFDAGLKHINKKYRILTEKYPDIIEAILDLLFPSFFIDIIRKENKKMCSTRVT